MKPHRRPLIAVTVALLVIGILGVGAYAAGATLGQSELRPEAGQEVDRDIPSSKSKSTAPRIVPGQASSIAGSNAGSSGFTGLTFQDQRTVDNGNQTSDTPPDQGLCVGSGRVIEPVNTVFSIYSTSGQRDGRPGVADAVLHRAARDRPHGRPAHVRPVSQRPSLLLRPGRKALRDDDPAAAVRCARELLQRQVAHPDRRLEELVADHEHRRLALPQDRRDRRRHASPTTGRAGRCRAIPAVRASATSRCSEPTSTASTSRRTSSRPSARSSTAPRSTRSTSRRSWPARSSTRRSRARRFRSPKARPTRSSLQRRRPRRAGTRTTTEPSICSRRSTSTRRPTTGSPSGR